MYEVLFANGQVQYLLGLINLIMTAPATKATWFKITTWFIAKSRAPFLLISGKPSGSVFSFLRVGSVLACQRQRRAPRIAPLLFWGVALAQTTTPATARHSANMVAPILLWPDLAGMGLVRHVGE